MEKCNLNIEIKSEDAKDVMNNIIDKICGGVSWLATRQTPKKIALEEYINDIQNSNLNPQEKAILLYNANKDIKRWSNIMSICEKAQNKLHDTADIDKVDEDWISLFEQNAGTISTDELQNIFSFILAEECNKPGSIPKALLNTLLSMEKQEADGFVKLASFCVKIEQSWHPLVELSRINNYYRNV